MFLRFAVCFLLLSAIVIQGQLLPTKYYVTTFAAVTTPGGVTINQANNDVYIVEHIPTGRLFKYPSSGASSVQYSSSTYYYAVGMSYDSSNNNLYLNEKDNCRVVKVASAGASVTNLVGSAGTCSNADGVGANARFNSLVGSAMDSANQILYLGDSLNNRVRKVVLSTSTVTTLNPASVSDSLDGFGGTQTALTNVNHVAYDPRDGSKYFLSGPRIWKISATGLLTVVAGSGTSAVTDGVGTSASFKSAYGLAIDTASNSLYVSEPTDYVIRRIDLVSMQVATVAGKLGIAGSDDLQGTSATFSNPNVLATDSMGYLYITEYSVSKVRKIFICPHSGTYDSTNKVCVYTTCSSGYRLISGACQQCPLGTFKSTSGAQDCTSCPAGQESVSDRTSCSSCTAGQTYRNSTQISCTACPSNSNCTVSGFTCIAGFKYNSSLTGCDVCPANQEPNAQGTACSACNAATQYFSSSTKTCVSCPNGATCNGLVFTCNSGYALNAAGDGCVMCDEGFAKASSGNGVCSQCAAGTESAANKQSCTNCAVGKYRPFTAFNKCVPCPQNGACTTTVLTCNAGYVLNSNGDGCDQCPLGQDSVSGGACQNCNGGLFKPSQSYATCIACPDGSSSCSGSAVSCPSGYFYDSKVQCKRNDTYFALLQITTQAASTVTVYQTATVSQSITRSLTVSGQTVSQPVTQFVTVAAQSVNVPVTATVIVSGNLGASATVTITSPGNAGETAGAAQAQPANSVTIDFIGTLPISPLIFGLSTFGLGLFLMLILSLVCCRGRSRGKARRDDEFDGMTGVTSTMSTRGQATFTNATTR